MIRINLVLVVAVVASALVLVHTQYQSRKLFADNEKANSEARRLDIERERLSVEQRAQSVPIRVERLAKDQLTMRGTTPAITRYVRLRNADANPVDAKHANTQAAQ